MANTYTQIYLHVVFAVAGRACVVQPRRKEELQKYITGIVTARNQKLIAINCMPDHTHILVGSKLVRPITLTSSDGSAAVSHGKKDLVPFPFRILNSAP